MIDSTLVIILIVIIGGALLAAAAEFKLWDKLRKNARSRNETGRASTGTSATSFRIRVEPSSPRKELFLQNRSLVISSNAQQVLAINLDEVTEIVYDTWTILFKYKDGQKQRLYGLWHSADQDSRAVDHSVEAGRAYNEPESIEQFVQAMTSIGVKITKGKAGPKPQTVRIAIVCSILFGIVLLAMIVGAIIDAAK